jgi:DNA-binding transcriptional LysR family regulator
MPEWVVRNLFARGALEHLLEPYEVSQSGIDVTLHLVYPHRFPPPKVAAFIHFVQALFERTDTAGTRHGQPGGA